MGLITECEAVVMGGSWGGTDAVIDILSNLPASYRTPIVVVLHRQKNVDSALHEIIGKYTSLEVREINEKEPVKGGAVYLAPPNYHVLIEKDKTFSLDVSEDVAYSRPSIDVLFESAALAYGDRLVGILLTGANSDGTEGLRSVVERNGLAIVQNPDEAENRIMPLSALQKVNAFVMNKKQIQEFLLSL